MATGNEVSRSHMSVSPEMAGVIRTMDVALKDDFILLYVPSDYGWEWGHWDGQRRCWVNRCGHAINPTHWTILPPEPKENA